MNRGKRSKGRDKREDDREQREKKNQSRSLFEGKAGGFILFVDGSARSGGDRHMTRKKRSGNFGGGGV